MGDESWVMWYYYDGDSHEFVPVVCSYAAASTSSSNYYRTPADRSWHLSESDIVFLRVQGIKPE